MSPLDDPGKGRFLSWVRLLEGEPDRLTLAVHGDVLGPAVGRALGPHDERGHFMSLSLEIGIRFVRTPATPWVLQEIEAWHIGDGYATGPARLWDEAGPAVRDRHPDRAPPAPLSGPSNADVDVTRGVRPSARSVHSASCRRDR